MACVRLVSRRFWPTVGCRRSSSPFSAPLILRLSEDGPEVTLAVHDPDAEVRKQRELVDARNQADGLIHASEKTLSELGDKASGEERLAIENAVSDLKTALEKDDLEAIQAKTAALAEASGTLAQKMYAEQAAQQQAAGGAAGAEQPQENAAADDNVVDAEFEEVKDDKK